MPTRYFLNCSSPFAATLGIAAAIIASNIATTARCEQLKLIEGPEPDITAVSVELEVGGDLIVAGGNDALSQKDAGKEEKRLPMSVEARVAFEQRTIRGEQQLQAARHYSEATSTIKVGKGGRKLSLADDRRQLVATIDGGKVLLTAPGAALERDELDLVSVVADPLLINALLPDETKDVGGTWTPGPGALGPILGLDVVTLCEAECVLSEIKPTYGRIDLAGAVHGVVDGANTELDVRAIGLFDRTTSRITQINFAIKEKREIGPATPGLDAVAKVRLKITPGESTSKLDAAAAARLAKDSADDLGLLAIDAEKHGFRLTCDRQWYETGAGRETVVLRRIDRSGLVCQSILRRLPGLTADRQLSLAEFQKEVNYTLGESGSKIIKAEEWVNLHGCRCFSVIADGSVEGVGVQYRHYLVSPQGAGHRISIVTTVEQQSLERLANADRGLADHLELLSDKAKPKSVAGDKLTQPKF